MTNALAEVVKNLRNAAHNIKAKSKKLINQSDQLLQAT